MKTRLQQVLEGKGENYILPFFWQHGEEENILREYMRAIHDANIGAVCVEARPHPDFAGEKWWKDLAVIIEAAKRYEMKVWILDDSHFPSGQAAGKMAEASDELQKQFINYHVVDVCGPVKQCLLHVDVMAKYYPSPLSSSDIFSKSATSKKQYTDDTLLAVIASTLDGMENDIFHLGGELLDLTDKVKDGWLHWDVPAGNWRIFVIYTTRNGGGRINYVNFLSKESCRMQINAVYEPHYAHFGNEFGKTIAGFFSDEPEIGNVPGYGRDTCIGNRSMPLPWSEEMPALMRERFGDDYVRKIPALWDPVGTKEFTAEIRNGYMDIVTRQCQKNFGEQLGDWCRIHGVEYIGHIIEDCGMSTRLGSSQGHFFRALRGQDWAGIDDIGGQITLNGENISHNNQLGLVVDGEFYHHVLAKMATSLADIEPRKQGRAMCELFGAYGWSEGTRLMKYIADHLLVRGINRFVPHAFSPKEFPDADCPPHFYAHGKNPLYRPFGTLMKYLNRISHLINGGKHSVQIAILYHAEAEWAGMGYTDIAKLARALDDVQIDYDFVPADIFTEKEWFYTKLDEEGLHVNDLLYKILLIPAAGYVPKSVLEFAKEAESKCFSIWFVQGAQVFSKPVASFREVSLKSLAESLKQENLIDAVSDIAFPQLQIYHYEQANEDYYLISNESIGKNYVGTIRFPVSERCYKYVYDAMENRLENLGSGNNVSLILEPYEMIVLIFTESPEQYENLAYRKSVCKYKKEVINDIWKVSFADNENYPDFKDEMEMRVLTNILEYRPDFSGIIRYETTFIAKSCDMKILQIEDAYDAVEVWCNGRHIGEKICPPYRFDLNGSVQIGTNQLRIEVRTTLERRVNALTNGLGMFGPEFKVILPEGIIGTVSLLK